MEPNQGILNDAVRHLRVNSRGGIFIPASSRSMENLTAGLAVARFFLQELGLSRDIARLMNVLKASQTHWYEPLMVCSEPPDRVGLAVEHFALFSLDEEPHRWMVSNPHWISVPSADKNEDAAVLPFYQVHLSPEPSEQYYPLYNAILFALQLYLFECLRGELHGVESDYLRRLSLADDEDDLMEVQFLAKPALSALVKNLPSLRSLPYKDVMIDQAGREISLLCGQVIFRKNTGTGIWTSYYQGPGGWKQVNPLVPEPAPASQILSRRDFLTYFYQVAVILAERKIYEIEKLLRGMVQ